MFTPENALQILKEVFPPETSLHDEEEMETYVYGPDDPTDYFAKIADLEELKTDFQEFLKSYERG